MCVILQTAVPFYFYYNKEKKLKVTTLVKVCILCAVLLSTPVHAQTGGTKVFLTNEGMGIIGERKCSVTPQRDGTYLVKGSGYFASNVKPDYWFWDCLCKTKKLYDYGPVSQGKEGLSTYTYVEGVGVYTLHKDEDTPKVNVVTTALDDYRALGWWLATGCGNEYRNMFMK